METIMWLDLVSSLLIKVSILLVLILWLVTPIYAIIMDNKKKEELLRLRKLNDNLEKIYEVPVKKAKEFLRDRSNEE
ncbi:hypothetical protein ACRTEV_21515 [Rossellomorea arthrocnemi]